MKKINIVYDTKGDHEIFIPHIIAGKQNIPLKAKIVKRVKWDIQREQNTLAT